jgi:hypothetical protein
MTLRTGKKSSWVALAAACLLVLQSVVGAIALGAGPGQLDTFGNPLCVTAADQAGGSHAPGQSKLPNCCKFGFSTFSASLARPAEHGILLDRSAIASERLSGKYRIAPAPARDHDPGNPRAPPPTA